MAESHSQEYKHENDRLAQELQNVKKKYHNQKRKEQLAKYEILISAVMSLLYFQKMNDYIPLLSYLPRLSSYNLSVYKI